MTYPFRYLKYYHLVKKKSLADFFFRCKFLPCKINKPEPKNATSRSPKTPQAVAQKTKTKFPTKKILYTGLSICESGPVAP